MQILGNSVADEGCRVLFETWRLMNWAGHTLVLWEALNWSVSKLSCRRHHWLGSPGSLRGVRLLVANHSSVQQDWWCRGGLGSRVFLLQCSCCECFKCLCQGSSYIPAFATMCKSRGVGWIRVDLGSCFEQLPLISMCAECTWCWRCVSYWIELLALCYLKYIILL